MAITEVIIDIGGNDSSLVQAHTSTISTSDSEDDAAVWPRISDLSEMYWWPMFILILFWAICEYAYPILIMASNVMLLAQTFRVTEIFNSKGMSTIPIAAGSISYSYVIFKSSIAMHHIAAWKAFLGFGNYTDEESASSPLTILLTVVIIDVGHRFFLHGFSILLSFAELSARRKAHMLDVCVSMSCFYRELVPIPIWYMVIGTSNIGARVPVIQLVYLMIKSFAVLDSAMKLIKSAGNAFETRPVFGRYDKDAAGSDCPVCFEPLKNPVRLDCSHIFCEECICHWADSETSAASCPMCRASLRNSTGLVYSLRQGPARYGPIHLI